MRRLRSVYWLASDRLIATTLIVFACTYAFEGPLRFLLISVGAEMLLYTRDLAALAVIATACACWFSGQTEFWGLVTACAIFLVHLAIGLVSLPTTFQALMGAKILMPFLLGMATAPLLEAYPERTIRFFRFVFLATACGVIANIWLEYPWVGASFENSFVTVEVSRSWSSDGALRLPGFTRASYIAAALTLVTVVPVAAAARNWWTRAGAFALAGATILLSTTKGGVTGLAAVVLFETLLFVGGKRVYAVAAAVLATVCLALPVIAVHVGVGPGEVASWQLSFVERIQDMWPRAFDLFASPMQVLWGRGLGGIGMAQTFDEWSRANAGDNLMVYVVVTFGIFGLAYIAIFLGVLFRFLEARMSDDLLARIARGWVISWLAFGLTTNMLEEPMTNMVIGMTFGWVFGVGRAPSTGIVPRRSRLRRAAGEPLAASSSRSLDA